MLGSLQSLLDHGRLGGTGYVSILPVDQGIEHSAGASFAPNPMYFDPENIVKLAIEGGCNARRLDARRARRRSRGSTRTRFRSSLKFNHNEFLSYPNTLRPDPLRAASSRRSTWARWASARRSTSDRKNRSGRFRKSPRCSSRRTSSGMFTVLWCYLRNPAFKTKEADYHLAADLTGQANHLGVTIEADIIKQKLPENNGGYNARQLRQDAQEGLLAS